MASIPDQCIHSNVILADQARERAEDAEQLALAMLAVQEASRELRALFEDKPLAEINPGQLREAFFHQTAVMESVTDMLLRSIAADCRFFQEQVAYYGSRFEFDTAMKIITEEQQKRIEEFEKLL